MSIETPGHNGNYDCRVCGFDGNRLPPVGPLKNHRHDFSKSCQTVGTRLCSCGKREFDVKVKDIPKAFGVPLWRGKIKKRIAKKAINRYSKGYFKYLTEFSNIKVGDKIWGCSGFNQIVTGFNFEYYRPRGCKRGEYLADITIYTDSTTCVVGRCGVDVPRSYEWIKKHMEEGIEYWKDKDVWGFAKKWSEGTLNLDGTFTPSPETVKL